MLLPSSKSVRATGIQRHLYRSLRICRSRAETGGGVGRAARRGGDGEPEPAAGVLFPAAAGAAAAAGPDARRVGTAGGEDLPYVFLAGGLLSARAERGEELALVQGSGRADHRQSFAPDPDRCARYARAAGER